MRNSLVQAFIKTAVQVIDESQYDKDKDPYRRSMKSLGRVVGAGAALARGGLPGLLSIPLYAAVGGWGAKKGYDISRRVVNPEFQPQIKEHDPYLKLLGRDRDE